MLISSGDIFTDTSRNNVVPNIWPFLGPVKLTCNIKCHRVLGRSLGSKELFTFYNDMKGMNLWFWDLLICRFLAHEAVLPLLYCTFVWEIQRLAARVIPLFLFWGYLGNAYLLIYWYQWESNFEPSLSCHSHQFEKPGRLFLAWHDHPIFCSVL